MIRADGATTDACGAAAGLGGAIDPAGLVSGIPSPDRIGYLAGVFLPDAPVTSPPPFGLDLEAGYESERFAPLLQQVFFIGDGVTSAGRIQRFPACPTARPVSTSGTRTRTGSSALPATTPTTRGAFRSPHVQLNR